MSIFIYKNRSVLVLHLFVLAVLVCGGGLVAAPKADSIPAGSKPVRSAGVYLIDNNGFARLEQLHYQKAAPGERIYVRSNLYGRYLAADEESRLLSADFFQRVRGSSPLWAAASSVLWFDRAAEYRQYDASKATSLNRWSRIIKFGLLGLTGLAYQNVQSRAAALRSSIEYVNVGSKQRDYDNAVTMYYGLAAITAGFFGYTTYLAYSDFGRDASGRDLRLRTRKPVHANRAFGKAGVSAGSRSSGDTYYLGVRERF